MAAPRTPLNVPTLTEVIPFEALPPSLAAGSPAPGESAQALRGEREPGASGTPRPAREAPRSAASRGAAPGVGLPPPSPPELAPPQAGSARRAVPDEAEPVEAELVEDVLAEVQRRVDVMLEYRLRGVLAPALARAGDQLIGEMRDELAETLRDVVSTAVAQELARRRGH